jgi:serine/threonine protein kinase
MKLCHHPNIVKLLDHFENAEYIFIVMEYIPGGDLGEYIKKINIILLKNKLLYLLN